MKKFLYIFLITFLFNNFAYSASGDATEYKLTIYKIELCETGSTGVFACMANAAPLVLKSPK